MNIIFGDSVDTIANHCVVLELDTFKRKGSSNTITAYCVVENISINEFINLEAHKKVHEDIIRCYKLRQWDQCEQAIQQAIGTWGGSVDTFYADLLDRVQTFKNTEPPVDWDGVLLKD